MKQVQKVSVMLSAIGAVIIFFATNRHGEGIFGSMISVWVASPLLLNGALTLYLRVNSLLVILPILYYVGWAAYGLYDIFYLHIDAQAGMSLLFVPLYGLPIFGALWLPIYYWYGSPDSGQ